MIKKLIIIIFSLLNLIMFSNFVFSLCPNIIDTSNELRGELRTLIFYYLSNPNLYLSNPNLGYTKNEILDLLDFYKNEKDKSLVTDCNALGSRTDTQVYSLMEKTIVFQRECTTSGNTRTCGQTNLGECVLGTQTCTSTYQLGPCVGEIKDSVEVCDNLDNNCNDEIDESLSRSTNEVGACSVNTETCMAGVYTPNNEYTPITEPACDDDLIDNDCVGGDAPTCNSISLSTSLVSIPADGSTTSTITASTSDNTGSIDISFTSDRTTTDTILPTTCKTDIDSKICTVTVKSSTVGASTISASASGYADESTTLTFTVPIPVCSAPTFPACAVTDNSITLSWDSVTGATQYGIDCEGEGQSCVSESIVNAPTTSKQYDGLSSNTQYTLKVKVGSSDATCTSPSAETTTTCTTTTTQVCTPNTEISGVCTGYKEKTITKCNSEGTGTFEETGQYAQECETKPVPILVLKYFPKDTDGKLDSEKTWVSCSEGNVGNSVGNNCDLSTIDNWVNKLTNDGITSLTEGSTYQGYKNPSAIPDISYSVIDTIKFETEPPRGLLLSGIEYRPDYSKILTDLSICDYVDGNQGIKQVWMFSYHSDILVPDESNMAMGRNSKSFWNKGSYGDVSNSLQRDDMPTCDNTYTLYNYNYGRGLGELIHNHGHQIEWLLNWVEGREVYGMDPPANGIFWTKFVGSDISHQIINPGCGWIHFPPNSFSQQDDGIYYSTTSRQSDCENWKPDGSGIKSPISCDNWGCSGNTRANYITWWMQNIPGANNNLVYQGKTLRNWWDFYGDFDAAISEGKSLTS